MIGKAFDAMLTVVGVVVFSAMIGIIWLSLIIRIMEAM